LANWHIVGLGLLICLALVSAGIDFVGMRIEAGKPSDANFSLTNLELVLYILLYLQSPGAVFDWYHSKVPTILDKLSELIKDDGTLFLTGNDRKIDNFKLYSILREMCLNQEDLGTDETEPIMTDDLLANMKHVEYVPKVKEYGAGPEHLPNPINFILAKWIGK